MNSYSMSSILFLLLLLLLPLATTQTPSTTTTTTTTTGGIVKKTCNMTSYYDFCVSSLSSDPHSPTADAQGLSAITLSLAISNATKASSYASASACNATADAALKSLLSTCAVKYADARDALRASLDALGQEEYDYAFVHVSAAAEYPGVCREVFRQRGMAAAYPPELVKREEAVGRLCTIAVEIISLLG